ncbi:MAG TPA: matrixin family metalloprotease [Longimicrobiales bacterium]|jgi:predicted Zn-dependent protease
MRNAVRLLALVLAVAAVATYLRGRVPGGLAEHGVPCDPLLGPCEDVGAAAVEGPGGARIERPVLAAAQVCARAGYLCAEVESGGTAQIIRWNENTAMIRVRIPTPPGEEPHRATQLRQSAARGIRAWHGHPFPIRVDLSDQPGEHDFVVNWAQTLSGAELGHARTQWRWANGVADLVVVDFALATRSPFDRQRLLTPRQVELTAAHEMGHALGLPHSDDGSDVMYPTNSATRLTTRDYRTMEALYELPNGAQIRR